MKIVACCKVVQEEADIVVLEGGALSFDKAGWKIGTYDLNAIEAGKQLVSGDDTLTGLCIGGEELNNSKLRKDLLSRGLTDLSVVVNNERKLNDSFEIASALKGAIENMDGYDLVICGTGSADIYAQQTGNILGSLLDVPVLNDISKVSIEGDKAIVERSAGSHIDVFEIALPAVISVTADINVPGIPAMRDIMKAGKKPVAEVAPEWDGIVASTEIVSEIAPPKKGRANVVVEGDDDEAIDALVAFLKKQMA